jgi:hypothetical protein
MAHLGTLTRNTMRVSLRASHRFTIHSTPTKLQAAFKLLGVEPLRVQQQKNPIGNLPNRISPLRSQRRQASA